MNSEIFQTDGAHFNKIRSWEAGGIINNIVKILFCYGNIDISYCIENILKVPIPITIPGRGMSTSCRYK